MNMFRPVSPASSQGRLTERAREGAQSASNSANAWLFLLFPQRGTSERSNVDNKNQDRLLLYANLALLLVVQLSGALLHGR